MSYENNDLLERLLECENGLENLRKKVKELEKTMHGFGQVINVTNQIHMKLFDRIMAIMEKTNSLLGQLPESIAKVAVEQLKKDLMETTKLMEEAQTKIYIA